MFTTYTKREMADFLSCSVPTIENDAEYLNLSPTKGDRGLNLYSESDYRLIKQMREHCSDKRNSRDSFVPKTEVEIVEEEPKVTKLVRQNNSNLILDNYKNFIVQASAEDPFYDLETLQRISDNNWLIPSARLAPLLKLTPKYLSTLKQYNYCGFIATKKVYAQGVALWKVSANNS